MLRLVVFLLAIWTPFAAFADVVDDSFAVDFEHIAAIAPPPGTVINASNFEQYSEILDDNISQVIAQGMLEITVRETYSIDPFPAYLDATRAHLGKTQLGDQPGVIHGYVAGRPFPEGPSLDDPRAGDKIAWNTRYAFAPDSSEIKHFYWQYRNIHRNKIERELSFYASQLRFKHRHHTNPIPALPNNNAGIYFGLYLRVLAPPDLRNTQVLIHRLEDDTERDQTWLYVGTQRRVRRLASGQTTDAFLGSDIMIEDFLGYNGRIMDMKWTYHGTRYLLVPFFDHDEVRLVEHGSQPDGFKFVDFHGAGNCFADVPWQVRKVYLGEAVPYWDQHPLSKRRGYVDAQTYNRVLGYNYDRAGKLWKVGYGAFSHPDRHHPANKGTGTPVIDAAVMVDVQAQHCTTLQFKSLSNPSGVKASDFSVQALRVKGR